MGKLALPYAVGRNVNWMASLGGNLATRTKTLKYISFDLESPFLETDLTASYTCASAH